MAHVWCGVGWRVIDARSGRQICELSTGLGWGRAPCALAAVALAIDLDDGAVIHQPVHCCHGHGAGRKHVLPLAERLVAGHQQGFPFIAVHHQLKQDRVLGLVFTDVANVVNDEQGVAGEALNPLRHLNGTGAKRLGRGLEEGAS